MAMNGENDFEFEMVNRLEEEEDSTSNNTITVSPEICSTRLIDRFIEDVTNKKETLVSKTDSVMRLMKEVECVEEDAQQAKYEADQSSFDILMKMNELKLAKRYVEETNDMLVRKVYVQKAALATKMEVLQLRALHLLDEGDRSLDVLDEMHRALQKRLTSASTKKELANKKKQKNDEVCQVVVAYQEIEMKKMLCEISRLEQEVSENSKLQDALINYGNVVDTLSGQISHRCQDVSVLKDELEQTIPQGEIWSCQMSPNLVVQSTIKKVKINNKLGKTQMIAKCKKLKIKGLQVVNKKGANAGHVEDLSDDGEVALFSVPLIMFLIFYILDLFLFCVV